MPMQAKLLFGSALGCLLVCVRLQGAGAGPIAAAGEYYLSDSQIHSARQSALNGDAKSATRLSEYYSIYEDDHDAGEFWLKVAAELGDCQATNEIAYRYASAR